MKILVTGGNGFIGSNFVDYLLNNTDHEIINIDAMTYAGAAAEKYRCTNSDRYTFYHCNIGDSVVGDLLNRHSPDLIMNFAAETHVDNSINDPFSFVNTNVLSTYNFICTLQEYYNKNPAVRILHMSTDEVYGHLSMGEAAFTEHTPYAPNSPYSATKASGDHLFRAFNKTYGLPCIIAHCSNNYGPRQYPEKFIPVTISNAIQDKPIPIYGTGLNIRDWLFVEDHCEALYLILTRGKIGEKYNIGGNCELTNLFVANVVLGLLNKPVSLLQFVEDRKGHDFRYAVNFSKLTDELGWQPKTSFENGLSNTVEWYLNNLDWVEKCKG